VAGDVVGGEAVAQLDREGEEQQPLDCEDLLFESDICGKE
jgi:hypothetical protein